MAKQYEIAELIFQSPFHRGRGCYWLMDGKYFEVPIFQSPFHRGRGCYLVSSLVDVILIASFSPLFIGVEVVTLETGALVRGNGVFQSPFHRGRGCYDYAESCFCLPD